MAHNSAGARLFWQSATLVLLLAATWLVVAISLDAASPAIVSAGRTCFTVLGLVFLSQWAMRREPKNQGTLLFRANHNVPSRYRWWQVALLSASGVSAYTIFSTLAIHFVGPALPTLFMALTPAVVLAAESLLNGTRPAAKTVLGTTVAVAGAIVYVLPRLSGFLGSTVWLGILFSVAAMLSMGFYTLYFAKVNQNYSGPMAPRILPIFAIGSVPLLLWAIFQITAGQVLSWSAIGMLAFLGIVIYVPVYLLQHSILLTAGPSYTALLGLATPLLVGISSALLALSPVPVPLQMAGMLLTILGMAIVLAKPGRFRQKV